MKEYDRTSLTLMFIIVLIIVAAVAYTAGKPPETDHRCTQEYISDFSDADCEALQEEQIQTEIENRY